MPNDYERTYLLQEDSNAFRSDNNQTASIDLPATNHTRSHQEFTHALNKVVNSESSTTGRHLSWQSAYILVISKVIGSGIFATPGAVVRIAGSIGLSAVLWVVGALFAVCGLAISLEYGCMLPRSGADKVYLEYTYPKPRFLTSTVVAVCAILLGVSAANCIVFAQYVLFAFDNEAAIWLQMPVAIGLLTTVIAVHSCLPRVGVFVQNVLGWIKVGLILFMIAAGLFVVAFRRNTIATLSQTVSNGLWHDSDWSWGAIAESLFKVIFSYTGLNNVNYVMNDVKDPVKTLKSVSISAFLTVFLSYGLINVAYFIVVPIDEIKSSGELIAALFFERTFGPSIGKRLLPAAVALSAAGNVMVVTYAQARLNQEIARQGFFPMARYIASSKPFNAPMGGFIVLYISSVLVITLPPSKDAYSFILDVETYPQLIFILALSIGLILLRYREPELSRPFKAWLSAVAVVMAISFSLVIAPFFPPRQGASTNGLFHAMYAVVGIGILFLGVVYWYIGFVLIPRWKSYKVEEVSHVLDDNVTVTTLIRVPI